MEKSDWQKRGEGHRQRLRTKFLERGITAFNDDEILELLLTLGTPRKDCKDLARLLLREFGSLPAVLEAPRSELLKIKGIGQHNSFAIAFLHGVARRYLGQRIKGKNYLRSSREVADYLVHRLRDLDREVFAVIFLDAEHGIIDAEILAEGTINTSTIYPRELIKRALAHNAAALVVAHNHPSGNLRPSPEDRRLTRLLHEACSLMHLRLLDHFIIGGGEQPFSFADHGLMEEIRRQAALAPQHE
jgi:DNA repair protein RadC